MKKTISMAVSAIMLFSAINISNAEADYSIKRYPGQREYAEKYRGVNFEDIRGTWSAEAVYTMGALGIAKGFGGGNFVPNGTLTLEQTLIFLTRLTGLEDEAQRMGLSINENKDTEGRYAPDNHHISVTGMIALLESKGILTQEDIQNIAPLTQASEARVQAEVARELQRYRGSGLSEQQIANIGEAIRGVKEREVRWQRPASREVVAYILGKIVTETGGITGDQQQAINTFEDWALINGSYAPYIEEVLQKGLMVGSRGNNFNPKSTITRAEMSQILYNAHEEQMEKQGYKIESGKILDIKIESGTDGGEKVRRRVIKVQNEENEILEFYGQVSANGDLEYQRGTITYVNGRLEDQQALREGQYIKYYIKPSGAVVFAKELLLEPELVSGKVIGLYENMVLLEASNGQLQRYQLAEEVDFKVNGRWNEVSNLIAGMKGKFQLLNGRVIAIDISLQEGGIGGGGNIAVGDYFHTGTVVDTTTNGRSITISRDKLGQNIETYDLSSYPNLPIYRDGSRINFAGIRDGDFLRVYFSDLEGTIEKIELQSFKSRAVENIYKGSIENFNRNRNQITLDSASRIGGVSNWESVRDRQTLQISDKADMYVTDANGSTDILIQREAFEDYGNYKQQQADYIEYALKEGQNIYLYTEIVGGSEQITRIVLREVGEYKFSGVISGLSKGVISIPSNQNIYYNNSSMVLSDGRLIHPSSLSEGDTITVYTHSGRNTAAVIMVEGEDVSDYPYTVYNTRLSGVNLTRQTVEVSGTGSQKIRGTSVKPFPLETLNLPTDAIIQIVKPGTSPENIEHISVERFLDRYYGDFEYARVKVITDSSQNILMLQLYDSALNKVNLKDIRVGRVLSKSLALADPDGGDGGDTAEDEEAGTDMMFGDVEIGGVRTWTGSSWSTGVDKIRLNFAEAIVIADGRVVGLDQVRDGASVYLVGDVNTGHVLIVR